MMITPSTYLHSNRNILSATDIEKIAKGLGKATRSGKGWICLCPVHGDRKPSLSIALGGDNKLLINCFSQKCSFKDILNAIQNRGLLTNNNRECSMLINTGLAKDIQKEKQTLGNKGYIKALWEQSQSARGTLVEKYLRSRSIVAEIPASIRFLTHHYHSESKTSWPCMLGAVKLWPSNELIGVHRTFLNHDGSCKASVELNKKMLGGTSGAAVRFGECLEVIAIAEGIETALSYWQETGTTTWAILSTSGFSNIVLPSVTLTKEVIILADHDDPGLKAAEIAVKGFVRDGRKVYSITPSEKGYDFNDLLRWGSK